MIDEISHGQQARGFHGRSAEEIEAALKEGEDEYEQRMRAIPPHNHFGPAAGGN